MGQYVCVICRQTLSILQIKFISLKTETIKNISVQVWNRYGQLFRICKYAFVRIYNHYETGYQIIYFHKAGLSSGRRVKNHKFSLKKQTLPRKFTKSFSLRTIGRALLKTVSIPNRIIPLIPTYRKRCQMSLTQICGYFSSTRYYFIQKFLVNKWDYCNEHIKQINCDYYLLF